MLIQDYINEGLNLYGDNEECLDDYEIHVFKKEEYLENDIFQVYNKSNNGNNNRLGWIFPIDTAFSGDHDFYDNPHFKIYAQICIEYIQNNSVLNDELIFENLHILILKKSRMFENNVSEINNLICSLTKVNYNLTILNDHNKYYFNENEHKYINDIRANKKLIVKNIDISEFTYLVKLLKERLKKEKHFYLRFILLYQIYEYLMEKTFYSSIKEYETLNLNLGSIREKVAEMSSEKKLINKLFNDAGVSNIPDDDFELKSKDLLKLFKDETYIKSKLSTAQIIYDIRNILVHNFYKYTGNNELLENIVNQIEHITLELLEKIYEIK